MDSIEQFQENTLLSSYAETPRSGCLWPGIPMLACDLTDPNSLKRIILNVNDTFLEESGIKLCGLRQIDITFNLLSLTLTHCVKEIRCAFRVYIKERNIRKRAFDIHCGFRLFEFSH